MFGFKSFILLLFSYLVLANDSARLPLSYRASPEGLYGPPKPAGSVSLLDYVNSRTDLSVLAKVLRDSSGFTQAFDTVPTWNFTFFAPSDTAFNHTGEYFNTYAETPKGKWWLGNLVQHHYIPNSKLSVSSFSTNYTRFQTGTFLYVGAQVTDGNLVLNRALNVVEADISVTNGLVHIIDRILDPSTMVFEGDIEKTKQSFIAGSCSNPDLPYC
ncbi:FAS1 domain-containing protein [Hypoxylon trugodes]|uniref:FAS1 domain-containing protein n=1 Tax=Hypoxylon trugodes TaxID=326681 RepID=UPI00218E3E06|nr:FAS1 domain-containing protein [Hypoxylon trugodes]KAI1390414.1 FAS1 domain-containing protein [Hypoxylon trugodes]